VKTARFHSFFLSFFAFWCSQIALSQPYDPGPDQPGSLAIPASSGLFKSWTSKVVSLERGWKNIALPDSGKVSAGEPGFALGPALTNSVVSLGDGGSITLGFDNPIRNGPGADFAVFENGFGDEFLELATVEVSSDGRYFVEFPSISTTPADKQVWSFGTLDPRNLYNLAGKYRLGFGTGFELEELKNETGIDVNQIRYVRIRDVVGSINPEFGTKDSKGNFINDPWPTPFITSGFDLDAVGVIHESSEGLTVFPTMIYQGNSFQVTGLEEGEGFMISDIMGNKLATYSNQSAQNPMEAQLPKGIYIVQSGSGKRKRSGKFVVQ